MRHGFAATAARISAGVVVWALHFALLYGVTSVACSRGAAAAAGPVIAVATAVAVALLLPIIVLAWRRRAEFEAGLGAALGGFALIGVLWNALPLLFVPACQ